MDLTKLTGALVRAAQRATTTARNTERGTGRTKRRTDPPTTPVPHGVTVEYTPHLDGDPDPGEVVWTWVPYEDDPTLGKDRPVVVIGRHGGALAAVALTSKRHVDADHVAVGTGPWDRSARESYAKVDRLLDVAPGDVRREGSVLGRDRFDAVVAGVRRHHLLEER